MITYPFCYPVVNQLQPKQHETRCFLLKREFIYLHGTNKRKSEANNKVDSEQTEISEANYKEKSKK